MSKEQHLAQFLAALNGGRGDLDAWLEANDEAACRAAIYAAIEAGPAVGKVSAPNTVDPVVEKVREALLQRSKLGIKKYGDTLHNKDYSEREILQHAIEESMDLSNYLMARIMKIDAAPDVSLRDAALE